MQVSLHRLRKTNPGISHVKLGIEPAKENVAQDPQRPHGGRDIQPQKTRHAGLGAKLFHLKK